MSHIWRSHVTHTRQVLKPMEATRTAPRCDAHTCIHTYMHKYKHVHAHTWSALAHMHYRTQNVMFTCLHCMLPLNIPTHKHMRGSTCAHPKSHMYAHVLVCSCACVCVRGRQSKSKRSPSGWRQPIGFFVFTHLFSNITPTALSFDPEKSKICGIRNSCRNLSFSFKEYKGLSNQ